MTLHCTISKNEAIKPGPKSHNPHVITLELIEDQEQGGKGIGNRVGATVGI